MAYVNDNEILFSPIVNVTDDGGAYERGLEKGEQIGYEKALSKLTELEASASGVYIPQDESIGFSQVTVDTTIAYDQGYQSGFNEGRNVGYNETVERLIPLAVSANGNYLPSSYTNGNGLTGLGFSAVDVNIENKLNSVVNKTITKVTFEDLNGCVKINPYFFSGCTALSRVEIPSTIKEIGEYAFSSCSGIKGVYIDDVASWCGITFPNLYANPLAYSGNMWLKNSSGTYDRLENLVIPDSVTEIATRTFYNGDCLKTITIGNNLSKIGNDAFIGSYNLNSVSIGLGITSIGSCAFMYCPTLTTLTIKAVEPPTLESGSFNEAPSEFKIYVPRNSVNAYKTATNWSAFADCIYPVDN